MAIAGRKRGPPAVKIAGLLSSHMESRSSGWFSVDGRSSLSGVVAADHTSSGRRVLGHTHSQQVGHLSPEVVVPKAVDELMKQSESQQERHNARGWPKFQSRRFLAVLGHGRL